MWRYGLLFSGTLFYIFSLYSLPLEAVGGMIVFYFWVFLLAIVDSSYACKERLYPDHLPAEEIDAASEIYVARVVKLSPEGPKPGPKDFFAYARPFEAKLEIVKALKGPHKKGEIVVAKTSLEEANARCPIDLKERETYFLFFLKTEGNLVIPRYGSFYRKVRDLDKEGYVKDVILHMQKKRTSFSEK